MPQKACAWRVVANGVAAKSTKTAATAIAVRAIVLTARYSIRPILVF
jgi:hypothetical protein